MYTRNLIKGLYSTPGINNYLPWRWSSVRKDEGEDLQYDITEEEWAIRKKSTLGRTWKFKKMVADP